MNADIITFNKVIQLLKPGAKYSIQGNNAQTTGFTSAQITWDDVGAKPTDAELDAGLIQLNDPTVITADLRNSAVNQLLSDPSPNAKLIRAVLLTILDENNILRQWIEAFKAQTALAGTLADLKSRIAALPAMPDRTVAQGKTAVQNKLNAGPAD